MRLNTIETRLALAGFLALGLAGMRAEGQQLQDSQCANPLFLCQAGNCLGGVGRCGGGRRIPWNASSTTPIQRIGGCTWFPGAVCNERLMNSCDIDYYMIGPGQPCLPAQRVCAYGQFVRGC